MKRLIGYETSYLYTNSKASAYYYHDEVTDKFWQVLHHREKLINPQVTEVSPCYIIAGFKAHKTFAPRYGRVIGVDLTDYGFNLFHEGKDKNK